MSLRQLAITAKERGKNTTTNHTFLHAHTYLSYTDINVLLSYSYMLIHSYNCFAGREASRAMAKMSFEESELCSVETADLGPYEKSVLNDWYEKFKYYRSYPTVGKVSIPPTDLKLTVADLKGYDGKQSIPEGRIDAPIYISIKRKIYDVSYGGKEMYSDGSGYVIFAGIDASKALAKMSFEPANLGDLDLTNLTEEEVKILNDWEARLSKKYPQVGVLID